MGPSILYIEATPVGELKLKWLQVMVSQDTP